MENFETFRLDQTGQQTQAILDQVSTNTADIAQLYALYEALTQNEPVIIQPSDTWPVADPQENVIYRVVDRVNTPPQSYSDYMWNGTAMVLMATYNNAIDNEPTPGSNNLVKSGGVAASIVFDISAYHATGSTLATYSNLAAALGTNGENVPASVRKGGMSVKFVNSSDNKYVQFRLMSDTFSTTESDWQGVDDEPTAGSNNLIKSGGVLSETQKHALPICANSNVFSKEYIRIGKSIDAQGNIFDYTAEKYIISWYYLIPKDCVRIDLKGLVLQGGGSLRVRYCKEPNDSSKGIKGEINTSEVTLDVSSVKNEYPYVCIGVYRNSNTSATPDLSNVEIEFVSQAMIDKAKEEIDETTAIERSMAVVDTDYHLGFIKPDGEIFNGGRGYYYSDYIPVTGGDMYNVGLYGNAQTTVGVSFYTSQDQSSILTDFNVYAPSDYSYKQTDVIVPFGAMYMRVTLNINYIDPSTGEAIGEKALVVLKSGLINNKVWTIENIVKELSLNIGDIDLFNIHNLRQGKSIQSSSPYAIIDYTANRVVLSEYIDIYGFDKIHYANIPSNGEFFGARFTKKKNDSAAAADVQFIRMNNASGLVSGELDVSAISKIYRYMTITVCRVDASTVVDLKDVVVTGIIEKEENSYSKTLFGFGGIAPKRACLTIEMDINGNSLISDTTTDFINICNEAGFSPSLFPLDTQASHANLKKWIGMGCEVGIHTDPADGIGQNNIAPHPSVSEFLPIVDEYIANFLANGIYPIGWVTSQGKMVPELVPLLEHYVGYAHTLGNGSPVPAVGDLPEDFVNTQQTDKLAVLRWGIEQMNDGSDNVTEEMCINKAKDAIDYAIANNGMVVLYTHSYNLYTNTTYTTRVNVLRGIIDYVKQKVNAGKLIVGTAAEICNYYFG